MIKTSDSTQYAYSPSVAQTRRFCANHVFQYMPATICAFFAYFFGSFIVAFNSKAVYSPLCATAFVCVWAASYKVKLPIFNLNPTTNSLLVAFCASALGAIVHSNFVGLFSLLLAALLCATWTYWQGNVKLRDKIMILGLCQLLSVIVFNFSTAYTCINGLLSASVSVIAAYATGKGLHALRIDIPHTLSDAEQTAIGALLLFITLSFSKYHVFALAFAGFCALFLVYTFGFTGMRFALMCALGTAFYNSIDIISPAIITVCALSVCVLRPARRITCALAFLLCGSLGVLCAGHIYDIFGILSATVIFLALPRKSFRYINTFLKDTATLRDSHLKALTRTLRALAESGLGTNDQFVALCGAIDGTYKQASPFKNVCSPKYTVKIAVASRSKHADSSSGDYCDNSQSGSHTLVILSDGMGTGHAACYESKCAVSRIIGLVESGIGLEQALLISNKTLISDREIYATVDALQIDTTTLRTTLSKLGAPQSFVIRSGECFPLNGEALPLGIVDEAIPYTFNLCLKPNDIIALMTDGITDSLGTHLTGAISDAVHDFSNLDEIANCILETAASMDSLDDMSIVIVKVETLH